MATKIWIGSDAAWSTASNWSPTGVPTNGDHVYFENSSQSVTSGLDQSAVTLGSLNIDQSFTGSLGTTAEGRLGVGATLLNIGHHNGPGTPAGSPSIYINLGTVASTITVSNTGTSADASLAPVRLYGSNTGNVLTVTKGKVSFGVKSDDTTSKLVTLTVKYDTKVSTDADVFVGSGVDLTTVYLYGGETFLDCSFNTGYLYNGTLTMNTAWEAGSTILSTYGGTANLRTSGTLDTLSMYGGTVDVTRAASGSSTISTLGMDAGAVLKYNTGTALSGGITSLIGTEDITFTTS